MKTTALTIVGIILGLVAGAGGMHQWLMPQVIERDIQLRERDQQLASLRPNDELASRLARLEAERQDYARTLGDLRDELESLRVTARVEGSNPEFADLDAMLDAAVDSEVEGEAGGEDAARPEGEGRERWRGWGGERGGDGTAAERDARRQEFVAQMQDNLTNFFTGELEKSSTPAMQQRLVTLEAQVYDMMELRRQMRGVEDEAERDALREAYSQTMAAAEATMRDQQRDMLDAIASQFNITNQGDQAAFESAVRAAMGSPFFSSNPSTIFWSASRPDGESGGFGGGGFGRGGDFGGGGRGGPRR